MEIKAVGTQADTVAKVDISKVHGGYFSDPKNVEGFIEIGIKPLVSNLPKKIKYIDFGGGQGHLAYSVEHFLKENGKEVETIVVDANKDYISAAQEKGLITQLTNLEDVSFSEADLITMRAVLHYNVQEKQVLIIKNIFNSLKKDGYLVHQNSSGNKENCELRSVLVNIPELGRAGAGNYHWISEEECLSLTKEIGFSETVQVGYARANSWNPEEQWDRFNQNITKKAQEDGNVFELKEIEKRKGIYLKKANKLIEEYAAKYGKEYLGIQKDLNIEYSYPIIVSRK